MAKNRWFPERPRFERLPPPLCCGHEDPHVANGCTRAGCTCDGRCYNVPPPPPPRPGDLGGWENEDGPLAHWDDD
jgi:hypothetical protein